MFESYEDSVLAHTDCDGLLSVADAKQLIAEHNTSLYEMEQDGYFANCRDAQAILHWFGY